MIPQITSAGRRVLAGLHDRSPRVLSRLRGRVLILGYHRVLAEACDRVHRKFGAVWHVNCHSMPSERSGKKGGRCADFVLGDRDGTTCAPEFTDFVARFLRGLGYDVRINEGYKGVEIVRRQGRPAEHRHSLQIEVDRSLYMDQRTLHRLPGFDRLRADLTHLVQAVGDFVRARL